MASTLDLAGFTLTFDDEFDGLSASANGASTTWQTSYFWGERYLPANGEQQFYSDATTGTNPFAIRNGSLQITAEPGSNPGGQSYTSGMLQSYHTFSQTYGYFEIRAELPQGQGMWPAFWLLPSNGASGEIDVMEAFGAPNGSAEGGSNQTHWAEHFASPNDMGSWATVASDIYTGYHTYGVDWESDKITWYFDGEQIAQEPTPSDAHNPMYMLANLAVGGNWPGPPDGETAHMDIDYIRAYSKAPNATPVALQPISSPDGVDTMPSDATDIHASPEAQSDAGATPSGTGTDTPPVSIGHTPIESRGTSASDGDSDGIQSLAGYHHHHHSLVGNGDEHGHWSVFSIKPAGPGGLRDVPVHYGDGNPMSADAHDHSLPHLFHDHHTGFGAHQDDFWELKMMKHLHSHSPTDHIPEPANDGHMVISTNGHGDDAHHPAHEMLTLAHVLPTAIHAAGEH